MVLRSLPDAASSEVERRLKSSSRLSVVGALTVTQLGEFRPASRLLRRAQPDLLIALDPSPPARRFALAAAAAGVPAACIGDRDSSRSAQLLGLRYLPDPGDDGWPRLESELAELARRPGAGLEVTRAISVVATVLNERANVDRLVTDTLAQLIPGDEFIVADGGSTDGTLEALQAWAVMDGRVRVLSAPGTNISAGRNAAIDAAVHDLIACTDAGCDAVGDWLRSLRVAFEEPDPPSLVAGTPSVIATGDMDTAQAIACYPQPFETRRSGVHVRIYGRLFGTRFSPRTPYARCLAFTKHAWAEVGGFDEQMKWAEDAAFGLAVSEHHRCVATVGATVSWRQSASLSETLDMYRRYGVGTAQSKRPSLIAKDVMRVAAYAALPLALTARPRVRWATGGGLLAYYSLPWIRGVRRDATRQAMALVPLALAVKDLGKVVGEFEGFLQLAGRGPDTHPLPQDD